MTLYEKISEYFIVVCILGATLGCLKNKVTFAQTQKMFRQRYVVILVNILCSVLFSMLILLAVCISGGAANERRLA